MRILLHQCCGPCSIYPVSQLIEQGHSVHGYWYNPNIHPYTEYKKRLETLQEFNQRLAIEYTIDDTYGLRQFIKMAEAREEIDRCKGCYYMRLSKVAEFAKAQDFSHFSSTLLYSRWQNHELIRSIAEEMAAKHGVQFWYEDYRTGWQAGIAESKAQGMYRQNYCGCIYSEEERWLQARKK
jgi:predicted adenine nucleotide alpha hydrolase (AANH) superfamily ATPase